MAGTLRCSVASHEIRISGGQQQLTVDVPRLKSIIALRKYMASADQLLKQVKGLVKQTIVLKIAGIYAGQLFPRRSWYLRLFV